VLVALLMAFTSKAALVGEGPPPAATKPAVNVWRQPSLVTVMVAAALVQGAHGAFVSFGALHMRALGYSDTLSGVVLSMAVFGEIVMFAIGPVIAGRIRPLHLIAFSGCFAVVRWVLTAYATDPPWLMTLQAGHAVTFGGTYLGVIAYIVEKVDPRQVASPQGMYLSLFGGFNALLTLAIGSIFDTYGGLSFLLSATLPALGLG
jgi:PPP family 3-phenylpropionic acid transporter